MELKYPKALKKVRKRTEGGFFLTQSSKYPDALVLAEVDKWGPHVLRKEMRASYQTARSNIGPSGSEHCPPTKSFNWGLSDLVLKCSGKGRETKVHKAKFRG